MVDLLSIGDTILDCFLVPQEAQGFCTIKPEECFLCFSYGDKVPVNQIHFSTGGNAANLAVGTTKLGLKTQLLTNLGDDYSGQRLLNQISLAGVDTKLVKINPHINSNYSTVISFGGERTILSYHQPWNYQWTDPQANFSWVYLTSMGDNFQNFYQQTASWARRHSLKLGFNPGSRQLRAGTAALSPVLKSTTALLVNLREAQILLNTHDKNPQTLIQGLHRLGPQIIAITDGPRGSYTSNGRQIFKTGIVSRAPVIERTGAGDAYSTGFLSALILKKDLKTAAIWGTVNSAHVIGHIGSQKGLLNLNQIQKAALEFDNVTQL